MSGSLNYQKTIKNMKKSPSIVMDLSNSIPTVLSDRCIIFQP